MPIRLYNTATRKKEDFHPIIKGKVGIYVCGVTVYDLCHIGHARSAIVFDVLVRYFRARGFKVTYVRNFTDIDDKIIERANKMARDTESLAQEYIDAFYEDMGRLGVRNADMEPRATEHINGMIEMIKVLIDKGFAYIVDGDVYYSVEKLNDYGSLSGRRLEDMKAGSRIAIDEKKRHPMDFTLWKAAKKGEPEWNSPWGPGRPGWHMECSVMSNHFLGPTFDIHGGGRDLLFPHHENERAQSVAANNAEFARYWVHNGFVTVEAEKMSKSLGNFITIRDALDRYPAEVLRLFLLSKHYRSPLDFSKNDVLSLQTGLVRIYRTLQRLDELLNNDNPSIDEDIFGTLPDQEKEGFLSQFINYMDDDLNTAGATGLIFETVKEMNRLMDLFGDNKKPELLNQLENERINLFIAARTLGILNEKPAEFLKNITKVSVSIDEDEVEKMISERSEARLRKDWAKADEIREKLQKMGIILEDGPRGTGWRFDV
ncbi:MAG: cysteine--tRNA ligase [Deltaproteobacteria bacterium]|nr:cysteine--tRNA ligase [Deltaproteobacteria bacterium]